MLVSFDPSPPRAPIWMKFGTGGGVGVGVANVSPPGVYQWGGIGLTHPSPQRVSVDISRKCSPSGDTETKLTKV